MFYYVLYQGGYEVYRSSATFSTWDAARDCAAVVGAFANDEARVYRA